MSEHWDQGSTANREVLMNPHLDIFTLIHVKFLLEATI